VYVFNTSNPNSEYCIFNEVPTYRTMRLLLWPALGFLELVSIIFVPILLASVHEQFTEKMRDATESNLPFFVWACIFITPVLVTLMVVCNVFAIILGLQKETDYFNVQRAYISFAVAIFIILVLNFASTCLTMSFFASRNSRERGSENWFETLSNNDCLCTPRNYNLLLNSDDGNSNINRYGLGCRAVFLFIALFTTTAFCQLLLFNSVFLVLAGIAAPVETGSLLLIYTTSLFCIIAFVAVIMKIFFTCFSPNNNHRLVFSRTFCIPSLLVLIVLAITLCGGIGVFVAFLYINTIYTQEYSNSRGIFTFLGSVLPALAATLVAFLCSAIIRCIGRKQDKSANNLPGSGNPQAEDVGSPGVDDPLEPDDSQLADNLPGAAGQGPANLPLPVPGIAHADDEQVVVPDPNDGPIST